MFNIGNCLFLKFNLNVFHYLTDIQFPWLLGLKMFILQQRTSMMSNLEISQTGGRVASENCFRQIEKATVKPINFARYNLAIIARTEIDKMKSMQNGRQFEWKTYFRIAKCKYFTVCISFCKGPAWPLKFGEFHSNSNTKGPTWTYFQRCGQWDMLLYLCV